MGGGTVLDMELPAPVRDAAARMRAFVERELVPLERELPPFANRLDPALAADLVRRLQDEGLWGLAVPRAFGGAGLGFVGLCALREALGHTTLCSLARLLGTEPPILLYGASPEQQRRFLLPTLRGERAGCFALTEPEAGSDAAAIRLTATPDGSDHYVLHGDKIFTSHADEADYALVFGVTPEHRGHPAGITLFLVEHGTPGFEVVRQLDSMGGDRPSQLRFRDCRVPAANVVGPPGGAFALAQRWFACDRIALQPPLALGAADRCLALAGAAGVAPAEEAQRLRLELDAARLMLHHAAWKADQADLDVRHEASLVKTAAIPLALEVIRRTAEWFGPAGYGQELPMERYARDLRRFPIAAGTVEMQQFIVARGLFRGYAHLNAFDADE